MSLFSKKSRNSKWLTIGSALLGGFVMGASYKMYGQELKNGIQSLSSRKKVLDYDNGYPVTNETDV